MSKSKVKDRWNIPGPLENRLDTPGRVKDLSYLTLKPVSSPK